MNEALLIVGNALALVAAWLIARAWFPAGRPEERLLAVASGWAVVVLLVMTLLGVVGQLHAGAALGVLIVVVVAAVFASMGRPALFAAAKRDAEVPARSRLAVVGVGALWGLLLGACVPVLDALLLRPWVPHWDDFSYHAPMAAHWLQARHFELAPANYHAYYPGNAELLSAWFMMPSWLDAYATLTGFYSIGLAAIAAAVLARAAGAGLAGVLVSAAFVLASEPFVHQARSFAAVDLFGASLSAAAVAFAINVERGAPSRQLWARILYAGACAGLATGAKVTFAPIGVIACGIALLRGRPALRSWAPLALAFGALALACGGYFYIRNAALTGNPLYPAKLLFLDGPFDSFERTPTTLLYQLQNADGAALARAKDRLLAWPAGLGALILAGYASVLLLLWPSRRSAPHTVPTIIIAFVGMLCLVIAVTGPFSGTANDRYADLQIRLRFFLPFALFGPPLLAALEREPKLRGLSTYALAAAIALLSSIGLVTLAVCVPLGIAAAIAVPKLLERGPRLRSLLAPASCVLVPAAAVLAISFVKAPVQEATMRKQTPAWNALDKVPDGARLTWFSTFERYKYYRAFGHGLRVVPVPVEDDGLPYTFLHTQIAQGLPALPEGAPNPEPYKWRKMNKRPRSWDHPVKRSFDMDSLIENLVAQRIEYVFVMRRHKGEWPMQLDRLDADPDVQRLLKSRNFALFRIQARQ